MPRSEKKIKLEERPLEVGVLKNGLPSDGATLQIIVSKSFCFYYLESQSTFLVRLISWGNKKIEFQVGV